MPSAASFLPAHLLGMLSRRKGRPDLPMEDRFEAAIMCADGGSAGPDGRGWTGPFVTACDRFGGSVAVLRSTFALALFPRARAVKGAEAAAAACLAATEGGVRLSIHCGTVTSLVVGGSARLVPLVVGSAMGTALRRHVKSAAGSVVLSPVARKRGATEAAARAHALPRARLAPSVSSKLVPRALRSLSGDTVGVVALVELRGQRVAGIAAATAAIVEHLAEHGGVLLRAEPTEAGVLLTLVAGPDCECEGWAAELWSSLGDRARGMRLAAAHGPLCFVRLGAEPRMAVDVLGDPVDRVRAGLVGLPWGRQEVLPSPAPRRRAARRSAAASRPAIRAALIGRTEEMSELRATLDQAVAGQGGGMSVSGPAGIGKSRLAEELLASATGCGAVGHRVRVARSGEAALAPVARLVASMLGVPDGSSRAALADAAGRELQLLGVGDRARAIVLDLIGAVDGTEATSPSEVVAALLEVLARLDAPQLLVLEDMQWADDATVDVAGRLAVGCRGLRVLVVAVHREAADVLEECLGIALHPLGADESLQLARALWPDVGDAMAKAIATHSGGSPAYVVNGVWLAYESRGGSPPLPATLGELHARRVELLPVPARLVAQIGAVIGRTFFLEVLLRFEEAIAAAGQGLRALEDRGMVTRERIVGGGGRQWVRCELSHDLLRDALLGLGDESQRQRIHAAVALAIEELFADMARQTVGLRAHHWERAGEPARASRAYREAARESVRRGALRHAARSYRACLSLHDGATLSSVAVRCELATAVELRRGGTESALVELERARVEAHECGDPRALVVALRSIAAVGGVAPVRDELVAAYGAALARARAEGAKRREAVLLAGLAMLRPSGAAAGEDAVGLLERARALARETGDRRTEGRTLDHLAEAALSAGRARDAAAYLAQAIRIHHELGGSRLESLELARLASLLSDREQLDDARALWQRALELEVAAGDMARQGVARLALARLARLAGDPSGAARELADARRCLEAEPGAHLQALLEAESAEVPRVRDPDRA